MHDHAGCQVILGTFSMLSEMGNIKPPNKYTRFMGEQIRKAREDLGLSQEELGNKIFRKRLAVSEMENGKVEISAWVLPLLASALEKPISYFFPKSILHEITLENLSVLEQELILYFRNICDDNLQGVALKQVKVLSEFNPEQTLIDTIDLSKSGLEIQKGLIELIEKRKNKE